MPVTTLGVSALAAFSDRFTPEFLYIGTIMVDAQLINVAFGGACP